MALIQKLYNACDVGDMQTVCQLVKYFSRDDICNSFGVCNSAIYAASGNHFDIVNMLINEFHLTKQNIMISDIIRYACFKKNSKQLLFLISTFNITANDFTMREAGGTVCHDNILSAAFYTLDASIINIFLSLHFSTDDIHDVLYHLSHNTFTTSAWRNERSQCYRILLGSEHLSSYDKTNLFVNNARPRLIYYDFELNTLFSQHVFDNDIRRQLRDFYANSPNFAALFHDLGETGSRTKKAVRNLIKLDLIPELQSAQQSEQSDEPDESDPFYAKMHVPIIVPQNIHSDQQAFVKLIAAPLKLSMDLVLSMDDILGL